MRPGVLKLIPVSALLLGGCEALDTTSASRPAPSVAVRAFPHLPGHGLVRSGEIFAGKTSWYSVKTNGGTRTASGEKLSDSGDTAAHRTLPFGTLVEVTNLANERSVVVRIIDRGPFKHGRVLDLSIGAAKKLGFEKQGIANCRVEVLRPARSEAKGAPPDRSKSEGGE